MSRLSPWTNTSTGFAGSPAARTASFVPSKDPTKPRSSGGRAERSSSESWSGRRLRSTERAARPPARALTAMPAVRTAARRFVTRLAPGLRGVLASTPVLPRHSLGDTRDDLVPDRPDDPGELLRGDPLVALFADQHDVITRCHLLIPAVHKDLVHGHGSGNPVPAAPDQDVGPGGEGPGVAVLIADRYRRHVRVTLEPVPVPVGQRLPGGESFHHGHRRPPGEDGAEPRAHRQAVPGIEPVDCHPRPNHVE